MEKCIIFAGKVNQYKYEIKNQHFIKYGRKYKKSYYQTIMVPTSLLEVFYDGRANRVTDREDNMLSQSMKQIIHPHQRCGYSDSPSARRDIFLYCRVQKWVEKGSRCGPGHGLTTHLKKKNDFSSFLAGPGPRPGPAKKDEKSEITEPLFAIFGCASGQIFKKIVFW